MKKLNLGERLEVLVRTRRTGNHGEFVSHEVERNPITPDPVDVYTVRVDGVEYAVRRFVDVNLPAWSVTNRDTGLIVLCDDKYDLGGVKAEELTLKVA